MSRAVSYFKLQTKRFFKLMPVVLALSALLICTIAFACFGIFADTSSDEQHSMVNIGIVGNPRDTYLGMAVSALRDVDSSRFSLEIEVTEKEEDAADKLRRGDLVAYIVVPDNFGAEAIAGNVQPLTCVTAAGAKDFGTQITNELMKTITEMVKNSQKAVYGFQNAAQGFGLPGDVVSKMGTEVALEIVAMTLNRETAYEIREIGTAGDNSVDDVLICGMLVLLLMLWGITCCTIFAARNSVLNSVLASKGTGCVAQVLSEYGAYLIFMTAILGIFALLILAASPLFPPMPLLEKYNFIHLIPGFIVPVVTISAMQFFLYEVSSGLVPGVMLQFFCAMGLGYISGCIYPSYLFSRGVQNAASVLPSWNCRVWLDELLAGSATFKTCAILIAYAAGFILLSVVLRRSRLRRGGGAA